MAIILCNYRQFWSMEIFDQTDQDNTISSFLVDTWFLVFTMSIFYIGIVLLYEVAKQSLVSLGFPFHLHYDGFPFYRLVSKKPDWVSWELRLIKTRYYLFIFNFSFLSHTALWFHLQIAAVWTILLCFPMHLTHLSYHSISLKFIEL